MTKAGPPAGKRARRIDIPRQRLTNQHLTGPGLSDPVAIVQRLGAVQAQDYAGGKWGIGLRGEQLTDARVEAALNSGAIVRTHVLRPTWHMMAAEDARWILALTGPRVLAANASYCKKLELDDAAFKKTAKILTKALSGGKYLTREELNAALARGGIDASHAQRLGYILMQAEATGLICSGPRRGKQLTYALIEERIPATPARSRDEMLAELARRYFATRGPATVHDYSWWSGLTMADAKKSVAILSAELSSEIVGDNTYWFTGDVPPRARAKVEAHLLPNYDEYFIGFRDRSAILEHVKGMSLVPGDPLFTLHVVSLNGQIVGGWKRSMSAKSASIEITLGIKPKPEERKAIDRAIKRYGAFLELPLEVTWG
jgi:hypothetical protein